MSLYSHFSVKHFWNCCFFPGFLSQTLLGFPLHVFQSCAERFLRCAGCNKTISSTEAPGPPLAPGRTSSKSPSCHGASSCRSTPRLFQETCHGLIFSVIFSPLPNIQPQYPRARLKERAQHLSMYRRQKKLERKIQHPAS